ncbi:hypothetical protein DL93DRAFT_2080389, partial [Clavulina sp. PMI_390]
MRAISNLPGELLLLVLEQTILDARNSPVQSSGPITTLTTITSVTSRWRRIAISHVPFWTHIYIKPSFHSESSSAPTRILPSDLDRVYSFIQRSKQLPLHLYVYRSWMWWYLGSKDESLPEEHHNQWKMMYSLLTPHMQRCSSICLYTFGIAMSGDPLKFIHNAEFPLLQDITFVGVDSNIPQEDGNELWTLRPEHISLRTLKFSDFRRYLPLALDRVWPSLSILELRVTSHFWPKVCDTLDQLPALTKLILQVGRLSPTRLFNLSRHERVNLPLLKDIWTNTPMIWLGISTPSLFSATICFGTGTFTGGSYPPELVQPLAELPLQELIFSDSDLPPARVLLILRAAATLKTLQFQECHGYEAILDTLVDVKEAQVHADDQTQAAVLPVLRSMVIQNASDEPMMGPSPEFQSCVRRLRSLSIDVQCNYYDEL